jgi:polysaccharide export outer membrane protein
MPRSLDACAASLDSIAMTTLRATVLISLAAACAWCPVDAGAAATDALGPGDMVRVTVFQNPDLATEATISADGTLAFPLLGEVNVAEKTPIEAGRLIAERLRQRKFVLDPQVSVTLVALRSRQVAVLGAVAKPGHYPLETTHTRVTDLLALAGGVNEAGDETVVVVTNRNGSAERIEIDVPAMYQSGNLTANIELVPGDTIFVPSAPVFYIYGAVQSPGAYPLEPGTSVMRALALGGGLTARGTERGLTIHRQGGDGAALELDAALTDGVEPNDVIRVKASVF